MCHVHNCNESCFYPFQNKQKTFVSNGISKQKSRFRVYGFIVVVVVVVASTIEFQLQENLLKAKTFLKHAIWKATSMMIISKVVVMMTI